MENSSRLVILRRLATVALAMRVGFALVLGSCGLDVVGTGVEPKDAGPETDSGVEADSTVAVPPPDACAAAVAIDDPLLTIDLQRWIPISSRSGGLPGSVEGGPAGTTLVQMSSQERGAIWLKSPVPLVAFDVEADVEVRCSTGVLCADGFAAAWLDVAPGPALANAIQGHTLGLPQNAAGGAVALDLYHNAESADPIAVPHVALLDLDGTRVPGDYDWHVAVTDASANLIAGPQHLVLRVRQKRAHVEIAGLALDAEIRERTEGTFGFTAATGGVVSTIAVSKLKARFYACVP